MTPPVNDRDLELLSAYIDNQLPEAEKARLEQRLKAEPALSRNLAELRATVRAMRSLPQVKIPRSFTLDPKVYGAQAPARGFGGLYGVLRLGTALATFLFVVALAGDFLARSGVQAVPAPQAAPAALAPAPTETADLLAFSAPAEASTAEVEAPVLESGPVPSSPTAPTGMFLEGPGAGEGGAGGGGGGPGVGGAGGGGEGVPGAPPPEEPPLAAEMAPAATEAPDAARLAGDAAVEDGTPEPEATEAALKTAVSETPVAEVLPESPGAAEQAQPDAVAQAAPPFAWLRAAQIALAALAVTLGLAALWVRARA